MLQKFLKDMAFIQVLNLLVKPIWILIIDAAVQDALPKEIYGNYFALFNFSLLFFIVLDLGLNSFNITEVASDNSKIKSLTGSILGIKLLLVLVYVLIVFTVGAVLGYTSTEFGLLMILCFIQVFTSLNQFLRSIVASLQRFKIDGVFMVLDRLLVILFVSVLLWSGIPQLQLTIHRFAYAQVLSLMLVFCALMFFLRSYIRQISISFKLSALLPVIKKSWPFALLVSLMGMYTYIDGVMVKGLIGDAEVGTYALGYRLYFAILMLAQVFSGVLLPLFSKNIDNLPVIKTISSYTSRLLMYGGIVLALLAGVFSLDILQLINPAKANTDSAEVLVILLIGFVGSALTLVYGALLTASKNLVWLNRFAAITLVLNVIVNSVLIPQYDAQGAAIATMISQLFFGTACFGIAAHKYGLSLRVKTFVGPILGLIILSITILFGKQYSSNDSVHFVMITAAILLGAYLFRLYRAEDVKSLLRK